MEKQTPKSFIALARRICEEGGGEKQVELLISSIKKGKEHGTKSVEELRFSPSQFLPLRN